MRMNVVHWGMQMTLLSSSTDNSCHGPRVSTGGFECIYNSGVIGISCLSIHKRW